MSRAAKRPPGRSPASVEEVGIAEVLRLLAYLCIITFCAVMAAGWATSPPMMGPDFYSPGILRVAMILSGILAPVFAYVAVVRSRGRSVLGAALLGVRSGIVFGALLGLAVAQAVLWERGDEWMGKLPLSRGWGLALGGLFLGGLTGAFFGAFAGGFFNAVGRAAVFPAPEPGAKGKPGGAR